MEAGRYHLAKSFQTVAAMSVILAPIEKADIPQQVFGLRWICRFRGDQIRPSYQPG
jgi:hypothetical protein